jgi:flagellar FliL protein
MYAAEKNMAEENKEETEDKDVKNKKNISDNDDEAEEGAEPKKKSITKKQIIIIATPALFVIILAVGLYFSGVLDGLFGKNTPVETAPGANNAANGTTGDAAATGTVQEEEISTVFYDLPEIIVNINSQEARGPLVKFTVSLELENKDFIGKIEAVMPSIKDAFLVHLRELRIEELEGSEGMYRLKEELLKRINRAIKPEKI